MLLDEMQPADKEIERASREYQELPAPHTLMNLCEAAESPRRDLLPVPNIAPDGTLALVRMREDLLEVLKEEPQLKPVDLDFCTCFARGLIAVF